MKFLEVAGIGKESDGAAVLTAIHFDLEQGQQLGIAGETGSGKSTLLRIVAGLVQADSGQVLFSGKKVKGPEEQLMAGHKEIAYLSQHFELRHSYRVEEVLQMASQLPDEEADAIYEVCRINHLLQRKTTRLSGGERQRVAMARLLVTSPKLFLLDEPFSNLDRVHRQVIQTVIGDIGAQLGITCVVVSHEPADLLPWAHRILVLKEGQIVQEGPPEVMYRQPVNTYVAGLFGGYNLLTPAQAGAFGLAQGIGPGGRQLMVRPEAVQVTAGPAGIGGTVVARRYFGSYEEVTVEVAGHPLVARTNGAAYQPGDKVRVNVDRTRVWGLAE